MRTHGFEPHSAYQQELCIFPAFPIFLFQSFPRRVVPGLGSPCSAVPLEAHCRPGHPRHGSRVHLAQPRPCSLRAPLALSSRSLMLQSPALTVQSLFEELVKVAAPSPENGRVPTCTQLSSDSGCCHAPGRCVRVTQGRPWQISSILSLSSLPRRSVPGPLTSLVSLDPQCHRLNSGTPLGPAWFRLPPLQPGNFLPAASGGNRGVHPTHFLSLRGRSRAQFLENARMAILSGWVFPCYFKIIYLRVREQEWEGQRERDKKSQADPVSSTESDVGLNVTTLSSLPEPWSPNQESDA